MCEHKSKEIIEIGTVKLVGGDLVENYMALEVCVDCGETLNGKAQDPDVELPY